MPQRHLSLRLRSLPLAVAAAALTATVVTPSRAHFVLEEPASWMSQDVLGSPQKAPPCGDEAGGTATGTVTTYKPGDTVTITINETIFHPGHYRVALAVKDRSELPAEPPVTPNATPCGSVPIMDPPVFPVLADGALVHSAPFSGPQTIQVTLPTDVTCDKCTLQIIEFMSNHGLNNPGGCFYHHCADIAIKASTTSSSSSTSGAASSSGAATSSSGSVTTGSGGVGGDGAGGAGGGGGGGESSGGCGCSTPGGEAPALGGIASLMALALLLRRRR